jgi:ferredoxin
MTEEHSYAKLTSDLRSTVKEIVGRDDVQYVIGYGEGSYVTRTKPIFVDKLEDVDKFIWNPLCVNNLTVFLKLAEKLPVPRGQEPDTRKIGIVVKGCDVRALYQLMQEQGVKREDVVIIGLSCDRCIDPAKFEEQILQKGFDLKTKLNFYWDNNKLYISKSESPDNKVELNTEGLIQSKCSRCTVPSPEVADVLVGDKLGPYAEDNFEDLTELEGMAQEEREAYWDGQFDTCIKCYACRNICPVCVCKTCVLDSIQPQWVNRSTEFEHKKTYHLMRAFCMLGRCIDCGECERGCPVDIPLVSLYRKGQKTVKELFDYEPGRSPEDKPIFTRYDVEDKGGTIW